MDNETLENLSPTLTTEGGKAESIMIKMLRSTAEAANEAFESATFRITAATEEHSALLDSDSEIHQTADAPEQFFTSESENATLSFAEFSENITTARDVEMFPHMDENVGNYIALGFFFAFLISVMILVTVVIIFCLKRRRKMKLEKSIVKVENPKYASQPSKYPQSFDFLSSQNVRAEFKNRQDESSATLITVENTSPRSTGDDQSVCTGLHPSESNKGEGKRLSKASDFPGASLASIRNDSSSDASVYLRDANENVSLASGGKSPPANKRGLATRPNDSPTKKRAPVASIDYGESESNANSESLSHPLLGEPKVFNRFLKSKESEITEDDDVCEDDDDENTTNQTTSLLKSKEQSLLSLGSYDQSLNPFCN